MALLGWRGRFSSWPCSSSPRRKSGAHGRPPLLIRLLTGREDIADHFGLTIETISRMVTRLGVDRLISYGNGQVTIINRASFAAPVDGADMAPGVSGR